MTAADVTVLGGLVVALFVLVAYVLPRALSDRRQWNEQVEQVDPIGLRTGEQRLAAAVRRRS